MILLPSKPRSLTLFELGLFILMMFFSFLAPVKELKNHFAALEESKIVNLVVMDVRYSVGGVSLVLHEEGNDNIFRIKMGFGYGIAKGDKVKGYQTEHGMFIGKAMAGEIAFNFFIIVIIFGIIIYAIIKQSLIQKIKTYIEHRSV